MDKILKRTQKHETVDNLEKFKSFLSYNPETGDLTYTDTRNGMKKVGEVAGFMANGYLALYSMERSWLCHRIAWALYHGEWPKGTIDHINSDKADNRICNLRVCSSAENMKNRTPYSGKVFKGVRKRKTRWQSMIVSQGKYHWIGSFECLGKALKAYDEKAKELHGEYAKLNLPTLDNLQRIT